MEKFTPEVKALFGIMRLHGTLVGKFDEFEEMDHSFSNLTKQEKHLLMWLNEPSRMGDVAKSMNTLASSVTAVADSLEKKGLIDRVRDERDRRAWLLQLSPAGQAMRADMLQGGGELFREVSGLSPEDIKQFSDLIWKVFEKLSDHDLLKGNDTCK